MGSSKKLLLVRHAKSDWSQPGLKDHERPLNERGRKDASIVANFLNDLVKNPDMIVSSTARRALETAFIMAEVMNFPSADILQSQSLYGTSVAEYLKHLNALDETVKTAMIFGHNPIIEESVSSLCAGNPWHNLLRMTTCSVACLSMDQTWKKSEPGGWILRWFITPKTVNSDQ